MSNNQQPIGRILLKNVRLSFAQGLWEATVIPGADANAKPKFNCGLIIPADHPQYNELIEKQKAVAKEKWGAKADGIYAALDKKDRLAVHDGDTKPNYDGYPGNFFLSPSAAENAAPTVIDRDRTPLNKRSGRPYSGCYVNASLDIWAQDNAFGQRINAQLRGIQFYADGDSFSAGRPADADEFEEVTEGAEADDFA